jgi:glyoxylase-like metal-dependent hydrolase (beta-lactamase superfamily II)
MYEFRSEYSELNGIYRIKIDVPFEVGFVCIYLFKVNDKFILFDAGLNMGSWKKKFLSILHHVNVNVSDIDYCFISHNHLDHIGLANYLKRKNPNIQILMHDITSKELSWETVPRNQSIIEERAEELSYQLIKFGMSKAQSEKLIDYFTKWPKLKKDIKADRILHDNDEIKISGTKLRVIWTPGHSLGHICLFDMKRRYLFSGDHILSRITPHIGNYLINPTIEKEYADYDFNNVLKLYLESLDRIEFLKPKIIFPAHQEIIYNPKERIQEIREHHDKRLIQILNLITQEPKTPLEIAQKHFDELDDINTFLAISEVLGHLIYLEEEDVVKRIEKDEKLCFLRR